MSFDISRKTFDAWKDYFGVVMQQGRVQMDADWNEWLAELARRLQAETLDIVGETGVPSATPSGFKITVDPSTTPPTTIGYGRIYVDGILAENHLPKGFDQWDPTLAEWSGSVQSGVDVNGQPWLPAGPFVPFPTSGGPYLFYLDVWQREVTYLGDPSLVDKAVGIETTGRLQTVWQVKYLDVSTVSGASCSNLGDHWTNQIQPSAGLLTTGIGGAAAAIPGPCSLSATAGYTGLENQLYRVEIHQPSGTTGQPTFKWSRDNATVTTAVTAISGNVLTVQSLGKDQMLAFIPGNWIEITNDSLELNGLPGNLCQIYSVDSTANTITLVSPPGIPFSQPDTLHTRITRWDQAGTVYRSDGTVWADLNAVGSTGIPVPPPPVPPSLPIALVLENGITVAFGLATTGGSFQTGDFWTFAARTADGSVETLTKAPPFGIYHHYCRLSVVDFRSSPASFTDCRQVFPSLSNPCIRVNRVQTAGGTPLLNGGAANVSDLANGINVVCDLPVDPTVFSNPAVFNNANINNSPVCFLTVDVPATTPAGAGVGVNPLVLAATVSVSPSNTINWIPYGGTGVPNVVYLLPTGQPLLARLTLKGNAIRSNDNPNVYLNGAATAAPGTGLQLPSGDGRPWADFEMWFWLISQPLVVFSPNVIQFDSQNVSTTSPAQIITVTNSGAELTISTTDATGSPTQDFAAEVLPHVLPPDVTVPQGTVTTPTIGTISVTFSPITTGSLSGNVNIIGAASGNLQVALIGTGIGSQISVDPAGPLQFPVDQVMGTKSAPQTVTVTNTGGPGTALPISISLSGPNYSFTTSAGSSTTLQNGDPYTIQIYFNPTGAGTFDAQLQINYTAAGVAGLVLISLTGTGILPQVAVPPVDGKPLQTAEDDILGAGLKFILNESTDDSLAGAQDELATIPNPNPPHVVSADPAPGTLVDPGSTVTLTWVPGAPANPH